MTINLDWLAGLTDGEGWFGIRLVRQRGRTRYRTAYAISLRADDIGVLKAIQEGLGLGHVSCPRSTIRKSSGYKALARWEVCSIRDCCKLVEVFRLHPLRTKKAKVFELWTLAVEECQRNPKVRDYRFLQALKEKMAEVREYNAPLDVSLARDEEQMPLLFDNLEGL